MIFEKTRALVLDNDQRSSLAVSRALARNGFYVYTAGVSSSPLAASSRFVGKAMIYTDPSIDAHGAISDIESIVKMEKIDVLFPITDISTHMILTLAADSSLPKLTCPSLAIYDYASDKSRLLELARGLGLSVPASHLVGSGEKIEVLPPGFEYPVVMKPTRSKFLVSNRYLSTDVFIAHNEHSFTSVLKDNFNFTNHPWLLQSFIEGTGQGVFAMYDHGRPVAWFAHERIREKPPTGGVSVLSRSAPLSPRLKHAAKALLDALEWHGPAMVEFRVTEDGTPYLMEINARFWGSLQLAVSSGVNFPLLAAQIAMGEHPEPIEDYKIGVYNRWLLGDLDNLYLTLKAPRRDFSLGQKLAAVGKFMIPWWPGLHYEINQWDDMGPFWHELKHYLR